MADHLRVLEREGMSMGALISPRDISVVVISSGNQPPEQIAEHRRGCRAERALVQFDEPELVVGLVRELVERTARNQRSRSACPSMSAPRR
jgi:hypothetical protein